MSDQASTRGCGTRRLSSPEGWVLAFTISFSAALLVFSLCLRPDPSGYGTHRQLGLPPCPRYAETGWPCLTCGMTTAFAYAARLRFLAACECQPFGTLLFLTIMGSGSFAGVSLLRGRPILFHLARIHPLKYLLAAAVLFTLLVGSWSFKARRQISAWMHQTQLAQGSNPTYEDEGG